MFLTMKYFGTFVCCLSLFALMACGNGAPAAGGCGNHGTECSGGGDCDGNGGCANGDECSGEGKHANAKEHCTKGGANAAIENMMSRRSIRKYKDQPVSREVLKEIMLCGINAPNGQNKQSWEVRVVDKPELQGEIKAAMAAAGGERAAGCFYNAPVWVFIARDKAYDFSTIDCGLLSENIMLAANALGVGSVCLGSPVRFIMESPQRDAVMPKLGFSEGYELCICIALGYPDEAPAAKPRDISKVRFID